MCLCFTKIAVAPFVAVFVRRLRQLYKEPGTVLPAPAVVVAHGRRSFTATAKRYRPWRQGGRQRRSVRRQLGVGGGGGGPSTAAASSAAGCRQSQRGYCRRRRTGRINSAAAAASAAAKRIVLLAQPERRDRRPGEGHICGDGGARQRVRARKRRPGTAATAAAAVVYVGHGRPQHNDR